MNIRNKIIKLIVGSIVFLLFILGTFTIDAFADEGVLNTSNKNLFDETNTFEYIGYDDREYEKREKKNELRFDLSKKIENEVDDGAPLLTVLTHGLGGSAADWSNDNDNFTFGYSPKSLISKLAQKEDCNFYWVIFSKDKNTFSLRNITSEIYLGIEGVKRPFNSNNIEHITDISKHSIIVFDAYYTASRGCNDDVYTEFNYAISSIVKDIKKLNNNKLPRMNLVGHSRGGITNMQYALDHPKLVAAMYSLGTPYTGTTSGTLGSIIDEKLLCSPEAENDILNPEEYGKIRDNWNKGYDEYYKDIKVNAYAGYSTYDQIVAVLTTDALLKKLIGDEYDSWNEVAKTALKAGVTATAGAIYVLLMKSFLKGGIVAIEVTGKTIEVILSELFRKTGLESQLWRVNDIVQLFTYEINFDHHFPYISFYNDCCVDKGSQLGYEGTGPKDGKGYKGFRTVEKAFNSFNCDMNALSRDMPPVEHNLEARDEELNNYILADINLGSSTNDYLVRNVYDDNGSVTNEVYIDQFLGECDGNTLVIPSSIYGKTVVGISDYAFSDNCYGKDNITTIIIPDSVKYIGKNAFYNSQYITNTQIGENSQLEIIEDYAFSQIPNLTSINITPKVYSISPNAFSNTSITNFDILKDSSNSNNNYDWISNVLVDKNVFINGYDESYKAIYVNPNIENIIMPDNVRIIGEDLFKNNMNIKSVDLNDVIHIGVEAFAYSSLENIINSTNVDTIEDRAFVATPWLTNQTDDMIVLGNTLISCSSDLEYILIDDGISVVNGNSFTSNVKGIIIGRSVERIGENAFINCPNLEWILFTSNKQVYLSNNIVKDDVKIYVPSIYLEKYKKFETFGYLKDRLETKKVNVVFDYGDDSKTIITEYYQTFDNYIEAPEITGMDFTCWNVKDDENSIIKPNDIFDLYEDIVILVPNYEIAKYYISFKDKDDQYYSNFNYGDIIELSSRDGYSFEGWYNLDDILIVDTNGNIYWDRLNKEDTLIAKYTAIEYSINYIYNGGEVEEELISTFSADSKVLHDTILEPIRFGYIFDCWYLDGKKFETTENIFDDITLEARWLGDEISIVNTLKKITVGNKYSIVDMSKQKERRIYDFSIDSRVTTVAFIGGGKVFGNFKIKIESRTTPLIIGIENITIKAPSNSSSLGYSAIESLSNVSIYLNVKGEVNIYGGKGCDGASNNSIPSQENDNKPGNDGANGGNGYRGGSAIRVYELTIESYGDNTALSVYGGTGGKGGTAQQGQQGSNGVNSPSGWFWGPVKGDNGSDGGTGGTGGRGGDGGFAIEVSASNKLHISSTTNCYIEGGQGGNGGTGGIGGAVGSGANDVSSDIWHGVGDPGDGGNGGNGGQGGNGGNGSLATNASDIDGLGGSGGNGGTGGAGGKAGVGGSAGDFGDNGVDGAPGQAGESGRSGQSGIAGSNTIGTIAGIRNSGYMFNKLFIAHVLE